MYPRVTAERTCFASNPEQWRNGATERADSIQDWYATRAEDEDTGTENGIRAIRVRRLVLTRWLIRVYDILEIDRRVSNRTRRGIEPKPSRVAKLRT